MRKFCFHSRTLTTCAVRLTREVRLCITPDCSRFTSLRLLVFGTNVSFEKQMKCQNKQFFSNTFHSEIAKYFIEDFELQLTLCRTMKFKIAKDHPSHILMHLKDNIYCNKIAHTHLCTRVKLFSFFSCSALHREGQTSE